MHPQQQIRLSIMVMCGIRCIVWAAWRGFGVTAVDPRGRQSLYLIFPLGGQQV